ncbi:MAG: DoxX family protein [Bacteroidales bacterium]|nr:DoxX family protein [Bacteroidales bacterium]
MKDISQNTGFLILRIALGSSMLLHGISKLLNGVEGISNMLIGKGIPGFLAYGVYAGEVIAPILLMIGFRTRIAALILVINMLVIFFIAHPGDIFALTEKGAWELELAGLYLFSSLALFFTGGGKFAVSSSNNWD